MGIISWVQCTLREGFVWGGLTRIHFWKSVKKVLANSEEEKNHTEIIYLKLFYERKKNLKTTLFTICFGIFGCQNKGDLL